MHGGTRRFVLMIIGLLFFQPVVGGVGSIPFKALETIGLRVEGFGFRASGVWGG